jgi:hypothetical protein
MDPLDKAILGSLYLGSLDPHVAALDLLRSRLPMPREISRAWIMKRTSNMTETFVLSSNIPCLTPPEQSSIARMFHSIPMFGLSSGMSFSICTMFFQTKYHQMVLLDIQVQLSILDLSSIITNSYYTQDWSINYVWKQRN